MVQSPKSIDKRPTIILDLLVLVAFSFVRSQERYEIGGSGDPKTLSLEREHVFIIFCVNSG